MGQRGPKPLPANVHQLRGNASKKPIGAILDEFRPEVEIPDFPSWIWPEAKKEWKRVSFELERYGLVSKLDRAALVLYCQAWAKMVWAERALMLLEHVLAPWEQQTFAADPDLYQDKLAGTRMVIQAAPEPPKRMQLRMYRGQ